MHFCYDYLALGEPPACVAACPMRALDFGDLPELRKKYAGTREIFPLPEASLTEPALIIKPHRDAARASKDTARSPTGKRSDMSPTAAKNGR